MQFLLVVQIFVQLTHLMLQRREGLNQNKNIESAFIENSDIDLVPSNYQSGWPDIV